MYEYSDNAIEVIKNFIKAIKRIAFGFRSFVNFRIRIFVIMNLVLRNQKPGSSIFYFPVFDCVYFIY
ncbi:transposase [Anaerococcus sp. AGMB00486]|uniref:Transposase n=2 Tax=Anaerococcus TaxID=165779 RepID=A0ABX2N7D2_9FIRM|nr:transposase [Anaerococcus porci]NVF10592.1 transposase [Anaerococcus faecalis]